MHPTPAPNSKQLRKERVDLTYNSGYNLPQCVWGGQPCHFHRQELKETNVSMMLACSCLAFLILIQSRALCLGNGVTQTGLDQLAVKLSPHRHAYRLKWSRQFLSWDSISKWFQVVTSWHLKLTSTVVGWNVSWGETEGLRPVKLPVWLWNRWSLMKSHNCDVIHHETTAATELSCYWYQWCPNSLALCFKYVSFLLKVTQSQVFHYNNGNLTKVTC